MGENTQRALDIANEAYEGGECQINVAMDYMLRGDGLASFVRNEIIEVTEGIDNCKEAVSTARHAVEKAVLQLQGVASALEDEEDKS